MIPFLLKQSKGKAMTIPHKRHFLMSALFIGLLECSTGTSFAETPAFDPEQPFQQAFRSTALRAMVNQALDFLEDHLEISGNVEGKDAGGDRRARFELKVYPKGKSRSGEHLAAQGWFSVSPDLGRQDLHLRFQRPPSSTSLPSSGAEDVL
jgi:hypothetical protein